MTSAFLTMRFTTLPQADESYEVGNADMTPVQCYLDIDCIIQVAKKHRVDAIHPGYGEEPGPFLLVARGRAGRLCANLTACSQVSCPRTPSLPASARRPASPSSAPSETRDR